MSATPPGPLAVTAAQRAGSARAGPVSLGGSVPAVERATTDSHTASVSACSGRPGLSLVPGGCRSPRAGLLGSHCAGDSPGDLVKMQVLIQEVWGLHFFLSFFFPPLFLLERERECVCERGAV